MDTEYGRYVREDKSVAVNPVGVLGVESHELVEHDVGNRGHAHRGTGMAGVCLEGGIDLQKHHMLAIETFCSPQSIASTLLGINCG